MLPKRLVILIVGVSLLVGALTAGGILVYQLERSELQHEGSYRTIAAWQGQPGATGVSVRLSELTLNQGEQATFEVCAQGDLSAPQLRDTLDFMVWRPADQALELKVALDEPHARLVKQARSHSCLTLGGGRIGKSGRYALDAVWGRRPLSDSLRSLSMQARVLAKQPLGPREGALVVCAALGAVISVLSAFSTRHAAPKEAASSVQRTPLWALAFAALAMALFALVLRLPVPGALGGLSRGLILALVELILAGTGALWVFRELRNGLRLYAPNQRAGLWLLAAAACALLLRPLSMLAMQLVPRTGEAPIEAFISWPSGALTFAMLGMIVPLAEELFFRGFLYGTLSPLGRPAAALGTIVLFSAAHAQQSWGNWGALVSVTLTGVVLTLLRAYSGSTLVPAVAHVLFNLSLWRDSFAG